MIFGRSTIWASSRENLTSGFVNKKGTDRIVHPYSLISAFVICLLNGVISKLALSKILIL